MKHILIAFLLLLVAWGLAADYQLTFGSGRDSVPCWSPDGNQIAFVSNRSGNYEIYVIPALGGTAINLTNHPADDYYPDWSSDGSKIVFSSERIGDYCIWMMNSDGSNPTQITTSTSSDTSPAFSPDMNHIAYSSFDSEAFGGWENNWLNIIPSGGGEIVGLVNNSTNNYAPSWSPDGSKLAFMYDPFGGPCHIYTMPSIGGTITQITSGGASHYRPDWSPEGTRIACSTYRSPSVSYDIWSIDLQNGYYLQVTSKPDFEYYPAWSPDGSKIAYYYEIGGTRHIWVTDAPTEFSVTSLGKIKATYK